MEHLTVVIKPTRDCNLRCKYCSVGDPDSVKMTYGIAQAAIKKIVERMPNSHTKFIWHGGEPLLEGIDFYKEIVKFESPLKEEGYNIVNAIQTNGTLINKKWAEFFKEYNFAVGLSIDGPKNINDKTRVFEKNKGAFDRIIKGSKILDEEGVNHGYLVVVSKQNVNSIDKIIDFMDEQKKSYKLVAVAPIGRAAKAQDKLMIQNQDFSKSQLRLFDRWLKEGGNSKKNALWKYMVPLFSGEPIECIFHKDCQESFIGVDSNGDVYPCGRFCGSGEFLYGNIMKNSFEEIWNNPLRIALTKRHENLEGKCKKCNYEKICNGGCPLQGYLNGGINKADYNCGEYKRIFSTIEKKIQKELIK